MENERFVPTLRDSEENIPVQEKFLISILEASRYFGIGQKKMRRLAEDHLSDFAIFNGNRYLIVRPKFEEYVIAHMASGEKLFK